MHVIKEPAVREADVKTGDMDCDMIWGMATLGGGII